MLATFVAVFTLDRVGRRATLFWGSVIQAIGLFLAVSSVDDPAATKKTMFGELIHDNRAVFLSSRSITQKKALSTVVPLPSLSSSILSPSGQHGLQFLGFVSRARV
jgi:hypothetical protein